MILLDISFALPSGLHAWTAMALSAALLAMLCLLSLLRSAVHSISESESRLLHRSKDPKEQRIYKMYQRREKVKASLSAAETFLALGFVFSFSLLVGNLSFVSDTAIISFGDPAWPWLVSYFVLLAFILVIVVVVPGRMMRDVSKHGLLMHLGWLVDLVDGITSVVSFRDSYSSNRTEQTEDQITVAIGSSAKQTGEKEMIRNILQFGDIEVGEIMTPRHDIVGVKKSLAFSQVKKTIEESSFSRLPVYEDNSDTIFGIVYVKDLLEYVQEGDDFDWNKLIRRITFVSENKKISDLLRDFQQTKNHMAAVSDEYGGISGLITMQDILEKIVGEISDEFDDEEVKMFTKLSDSFYIFDGRVMIDDFCRELALDSTYFDDVKGDAESIAGVILEIRGEFPPKGEKIKCRDLTFTVEAFSGRRIERIGVRIS